MASTERWRRAGAVGINRPDLTRLLLDETIRLLDPGTTAELSIPRPRTEGELADLLWRFLGVRIPDVQVCAHHSTPWRAFTDAYFARHPVSIWKGARGLAGKSYTLALLAWVEALTLRADVVILGGSGEQSERVHDYLRGYWMRPGAPAEALASDPSKKRTSLIWGNGITALLASQRSVRGPHPQRLRCLAGNTPIATPSGWRNIADLYAGDAVYSWHAGQLVVGTVTRAWCSGTLETVRLVTDAGSIRCTPDHRVLAADGRWVEAEQATVVQAVRRELWRDRAVGQAGAEVVHGLLSRVGNDCEQAEMPYLRRQEEHVVRAVPVVPVRQPSEGGGPVCGLPREAAKQRVEAVSPVSLVVDERGRGGAVRAGQSYGARRSAAQPSGGPSGGTVGDVRPVVRAAAPDGTMGAGLLDRIAVVGGGGARGVLARPTGAHGHRREETGGPSTTRIVGVGVAHGPDAQVVVAAYGARVEGPRLVVPVYDITVTHGTFIADGIVVHNCDEIDAMDWSILEAALGQPMGRGDIDSQTVLSSTHQNADGTMTKALQMQAERGWSVHEWSLAQGTMVATPEGEKPIECMGRGDDVLTRYGWRRVQHVTLMGTKPVLSLGLSNGRVLRLTDDHRVATAAGWVRAEHLSVGMALLAPPLEALPAMTTVVSRGDVGVFGSVFVPGRAGGACELCGDVRGASHVHAVADGDAVCAVGTNAGANAADVVDLVAFRNVSNEQSVSEPMGERLAGCLFGDAAVAMRVRSTGPNPTPGLLVHHDTSEQVGLVNDNSAAGGDGLVAASDAFFAGGRGAALADVHVVSITRGVIAIPVWDIGVENDHEFVAEGVIVHNCWRETVEPHGWISQRAVDRKRSEMTAESWRVEVELGEPAPENRAMLQEKVDACFSGVSRSVREGEYVEFEPPVAGASYATGADWARDVDFTEIATIRADVWPMRLVAYERLQRRPMPDMVGRLDARLRRFPGEAAHDNTGGGNYLADWIEEPVEDVNLVGRQRGELFTNYIAAIEREELVAPRVEPLYSQHKFCKNDDLFGNGHPPDGVVACALAYKASLSARKPYRMIDTSSTAPSTPGGQPAAPQHVRDGLGRALDFLGKR